VGVLYIPGDAQSIMTWISLLQCPGERSEHLKAIGVNVPEFCADNVPKGIEQSI
jgi:hypothetical protein